MRIVLTGNTRVSEDCFSLKNLNSRFNRHEAWLSLGMQLLLNACAVFFSVPSFVLSARSFYMSVSAWGSKNRSLESTRLSAIASSTMGDNPKASREYPWRFARLVIRGIGKTTYRHELGLSLSEGSSKRLLLVTFYPGRYRMIRGS